MWLARMTALVRPAVRARYSRVELAFRKMTPSAGVGILSLVGLARGSLAGWHLLQRGDAHGTEEKLRLTGGAGDSTRGAACLGQSRED